jgi:DNA repair protein RadD
MLRPTLSTGLYVQMAGRGMRPKSHTDHCLVLDFAGVVQTHGPITAVNPKEGDRQRRGRSAGQSLRNCNELNHISAKECVACGEPFPAPKPIKQSCTTTTSWVWTRPR